MNNKIRKICPLIKTNCRECECGWYDEYFEKCSVLVTAESMNDFTSLVEDKYDDND